MMIIKQTKCPGSKVNTARSKHHFQEINQNNSTYGSSLASNNNANKLDKEKVRAELISQIVCPPDRAIEFNSDYSGSTLNSNSSYLASSHIAPEPKKKLLNTYPVQGLRFCPYVETLIELDNQKCTKNIQYNCKCESCKNQQCPSKTACPRAFKDNIMTFSDRCTMTPKVTDACCGACPPRPATLATSNVSVTAPDVAERDTETLPPPQKCCRPQCNSIPKLKKMLCRETYYFPSKREAVPDLQEPEREISYECRPKSPRPIIKNNKKSSKCNLCDTEVTRKVIYNEGISDMVANQPSFSPCPLPPCINIGKKCSRVSIRSKCIEAHETEIPFSHRSESKYHHRCLKSHPKRIYVTDDRRCLLECAKVPRRCCQGKLVKAPRGPCCAMPKRVLESDNDIESFIEKNSCRFVELKKKKSKCCRIN